MSYKILKLGPADFLLAKELFFFFQIDDGEPNPVLPSDEYLKNILYRDDFHVLVAVRDNKVIGGLTAYELFMYKEEVNEIFLYEIGVEPAFRRLGVARTLIEYLIEIGRERGIKEVYVGAMKDNTTAIKLYNATGGNIEEVAWFVYKL